MKCKNSNNLKKNSKSVKIIKKNNEEIVVTDVEKIMKECFTDFQYECMVIGIHNFNRDD